MSYIKQSLSVGEEIVNSFELHWFSYLPVVLWTLLTPFTFGISSILAIYSYLRIKTLEQGITNKRVILKKGIISRKTDEIKVKSIETVEIVQSIAGRIFGFGNVKVTGRGISDVIFKFIDDPMAVKRQIESISNPVD